ncbi:helix-turn-helix transcriptional regulator [Fodinibius sediminis]|uniref:Transcriptional regulator n=1 Tax=Fodinibius sediminis TaxID=1214077 RepID=A0A521BL17_9BACT|nr:DeoR family transcriptional regulator [Fodinibius sediminis]SMO47786.1 transcriptional regulator [Fodinibius sediminis]
MLDLIKRRGTLSIDEATAHIDLAKTTLREHFLQLERDGYVKRDYVRSGPGRPSLQYQLTPKGNQLFPSFESSLIRELIDYLKTREQEEMIESFFSSFWEARLEKARGAMDQAPTGDLQGRLQALEEMLQEEGFMPELDLDQENNILTVKECNCPFREVVKETRLPCKLETLFYQQLFNNRVDRKTYIAEGDHSCTYEIPLDNS